MPVVNSYGPRKVAPAALPGVRKTAAETPISEGAGVAAAEADKFGAMGQFGATGLHGAASLLSSQREWRDQEKRRADAIAVMRAKNELASFTNQRLYDPDAGALTLKGEKALGLPEQVGAEYEQRAGEIAAGLNSDEQRIAFEQATGEQRQELDHTLRRHVYGEMQRYEGEQLQASTSNAIDSAVAAAADPKADLPSIGRAVGSALAGAIEDIRTHGPNIGHTPAQIEQDVAIAKTKAYGGSIRALLAQDKTSMARTFYEEVKDDITVGEERTHLAQELEVATTRSSGLAAAGDIWATVGPKGDNDPINFDQMRDAAEKKYGEKDPKVYEATMNFLRERKASVAAARADRLDAAAGGAYLAASQGAPLAVVMRSPEFNTLPAKKQAEIIDYITARADRAASRAAVDEGRAYTADQRTKAKKEEAGWARYWDLSEPETLRKLSSDQLNGFRGSLGDEHVNRLFAQQRTLGKTDDQVRSATIDDDLFKTLASKAGYTPYAPKNDSVKAELGQLKNAVETQINTAQEAKGKLLTRDEKQQIMQGIIDQKVMLNVWFTDPERVAATVTDAEKPTAYVPLAKIPPGTLTEYLNYARSLSPTLQTVPDVEIRARFTDRIQRAFANRMLGGSRAEQIAIMQGKD